jgi:hypothetical protein
LTVALRDGESGIQTSNVDGESTAMAWRSDAKEGIENHEHIERIST